MNKKQIKILIKPLVKVSHVLKFETYFYFTFNFSSSCNVVDSYLLFIEAAGNVSVI